MKKISFPRYELKWYYLKIQKMRRKGFLLISKTEKEPFGGLLKFEDRDRLVEFLLFVNDSTYVDSE